MSAVSVRNVSMHFGNSVALDDVSFDTPDRSITCLLGPSGSGKSSLLGCISGLITPTSGDIEIGDRSMLGVPTHKRPLTLLMQNAQLFAHLCVVENVEFGLRVRKVSKPERRQRALELLELVGLGGFAERSPSELSGGEQQRVALARALAVDPEVLLADEPLANLDPAVRRSLQDALLAIHRDLGTTILFVTHDVAEAMTMADQIVVLADGRFHTSGTPHEVMSDPGTRTAAELLGLTNVFELSAVGGPLALYLDALPSARPATRSHTWVIHPNHVRIAEVGPLGGTVTATRLLGTVVEVTVAVDQYPVLVTVEARSAPSLGDDVCLEMPPDHLVEVDPR